jgi:hypothetical protein
VHEPDIAPLARRLAEENNVDWRHLIGSGDGGRVVERDVLGYLARVMAGEEDVDPTPEPVPDGMAAWPEHDVAAYRARDAVRSEAESPPTLDDELFLFDEAPFDEPELRPQALGPGSSGPDEAGNGGLAVEDDALLLMGDDGDRGGVPSHDGDVAWSADARRIDELPDLTELDLADGEPAGEDLRAPGGRSSYALPDLFASDGTPSAAPAGPEPELLFDDSDAAGRRNGAADGSSEGDALAWSADGGALAWSSEGDALAWSSEGDALAWSEGGDVDDAPSADGDVGDTWLADGAPSVGGEARPASDVEFVPFGDGATARAAGITIGAATAPDDAANVAPAVADGPGVAFVRHGQVWRRRFDDRPLRKAVSEVAAELQAAPNSVAAVLLARAAWRAGAVTGPIDILGWHGERAFRGPATGDLRAAVGGLAPADASRTTMAPALVVADLSQLDLDEAVLHLEAPVLALGRSLGDGAWLCLSGDDVEPAAVNALAGIAELLMAPVRLLV